MSRTVSDNEVVLQSCYAGSLLFAQRRWYHCYYIYFWLVI